MGSQGGGVVGRLNVRDNVWPWASISVALRGLARAGDGRFRLLSLPFQIDRLSNALVGCILAVLRAECG